MTTEALSWKVEPCVGCGAERDYDKQTALTCGHCERPLCWDCYGHEGEKYEDSMCNQCLAASIARGFPRYQMATVAWTGAVKPEDRYDISRDKPDLCIVRDEDGENYVGEWVAGFGFHHVRFPKATTRDLTEVEIEHFLTRILRTPARDFGYTREQLTHRGPTPTGLPSQGGIE